MMRWWKRLGKNHKGFSLVELICTIAIFSIIITGVGTAMVVSARSYQSGSVELDLQQQAQITSNLLTNLIIDADRVVEASGSRLVLEKVESNELVTYEVILASDGNGGHQITYTSNGVSGILAENVTATGFSVSQDDGGNVDFTLGFKEGAREYESVYHVTPRNGVTSGGAAATGAASLFVENDIVLEPGEVYDLNVRVLGTSVQGFTIQSLEGHTDTTGTKVEVQDANTAHITVGLGETSGVFHFEIKPQDSSIASQYVNVRVRRVNATNVDGYMVNGTVNKAGGNYKVIAPLSGTNLDREPGAWYDVNYVNPYEVDWSFEFTREDENGNYTTPNVWDYIEKTGQGVDGNVPYVTFRLKQDMTEGCALKVTGIALHPEGKYPVDSSNQTNKSGEKYGTVSGNWVLEYQAWRRTGKLDIGPALDDSYFYPPDALGNKYFMGTGEVHLTGYSQNGQVVDGHYQMNYFGTTSTDGYVTGEPGYGDINIWELVLNTENSHDKMAYSSPYFTYGGEGFGYWSDCARYEIRLEYTVTAGIHAGETVTLDSTHSIEDVKIKFRNAVNTDWNRTNKVYVTTSDSTNLYNVYYMFDKGWEGAEYKFADLARFVGVVHEDADDTKDVRKDITVIGQYSDGAGNCYITFSLSNAEKEECKTIAASNGGIIREIYEYNPYFGKLSSWANWDGSISIGYPYNSWTGSQVTGADLAAVKGCEGTVEFHFVDPNIEGFAENDPNRPKVMYCPTLAEYGPLYYIDDNTRFVIQTANAQYQQLIGGTWSTVVNLTWNGSGWTAN